MPEIAQMAGVEESVDHACGKVGIFKHSALRQGRRWLLANVWMMQVPSARK